MLIVDAHLDLSMNALQWNRDITRSVGEIRSAESWRKNEKGRGTNTVAIPELRKQISPFVCDRDRTRQPAGQSVLDSRRKRSPRLSRMAARLLPRAMQTRELRQLRTSNEIARHVREWREDAKDVPIGFLLSMEGADCVLDPDDLEHWHAEGLRFIGPHTTGACLCSWHGQQGCPHRSWA